VADTLAQIDPNNPDNYQLIAIAYQGQVKAVTDPKQKKALTDSISKYVVASDKLPVRVSFSEFTHDGSKYTLSGTVENPDAKPKAASFVFKFIDKSGKVVTTDTTAVTLGPSEKKTFTLNPDNAQIAAFRYDPATVK
jgi:hypothetical protein